MENYLKGKQGKYEGVLNNNTALENYIKHKEELNEKMNSRAEFDKNSLEKQIEAIVEEVKKELCQAIQE